MNNFDKIKLTVELFQDLKILNTPYHAEDLKRKHLYDEWLELMDSCRAILFCAGDFKIYQKEFDIPQMSVYLDDYIIREKFINMTEQSYM